MKQIDLMQTNTEASEISVSKSLVARPRRVQKKLSTKKTTVIGIFGTDC